MSSASLPLAAPRAEPTVAPAWPSVLILVGVFAIPVLAAVRPVADWDIWWHLRTGQWIVEHGQVTSTDPFSAYGADQPWLAYSWLFEVLLFVLYQWLGLAGIIVYRAAMSLALVAGFQRLAVRVEPRFLVSSLLATVAGIAVIPLLSERPWLFTILFTTITLQVVLDLRAGRRSWTFWALPLIYILWANIHIQFVYGFLILGLAGLAPILDRTPAPYYKHLVGLSITCVLATLVNPYHFRVYGVVIEYALQSVPYQFVEELLPPSFKTKWDWILLSLVLLTAFTLGRKKTVSSFELLLFAASAFLWCRMRRDLWMVILSALVILPALIPAHAKLQTSIAPRRGDAIRATALVLLLALLLGVLRGLTPERLEQEEAKVYPARAVEALRTSGETGPLYNHFNLGGYLIWKLPDLRVSVDGRTNLHGDERLLHSFNTWAGVKGWDEDPELAAARIVFADPSSALASLLRHDSSFKVMHEDEQAMLFIRR
jgi:hypothetical protein